mgnify:CR=1 FL=1
MLVSLKKFKNFLLVSAFSLLFGASAQASNPLPGSSVNKMIIGDSIFALSGDIRRYLEADLGEKIDSHARSAATPFRSSTPTPTSAASRP